VLEWSQERSVGVKFIFTPFLVQSLKRLINHLQCGKIQIYYAVLRRVGGDILARADASEAKKASEKRYNLENIKTFSVRLTRTDPLFEEIDSAVSMYNLPKVTIVKDALHRWLENSDEYAFELKAKRGEIEEDEQEV